jgi:hypothetical protein
MTQTSIKPQLTSEQRIAALETALETLSVIALDSLRAEYQLCNLVGSLMPKSNIKDRAAQLKTHADTVKGLISQFELKDIPF